MFVILVEQFYNPPNKVHFHSRILHCKGISNTFLIDHSELIFYLGERKNVVYPVTVILYSDIVFDVTNKADLPCHCVVTYFYVFTGIYGVSE